MRNDSFMRSQLFERHTWERLNSASVTWWQPSPVHHFCAPLRSTTVSNINTVSIQRPYLAAINTARIYMHRTHRKCTAVTKWMTEWWEYPWIKQDKWNIERFKAWVLYLTIGSVSESLALKKKQRISDRIKAWQTSRLRRQVQLYT